MNQPRATLAAGMQVTPSVRLLSPLGSGGMGAVWLADHTALNTRVVVKFMLGGLDSSASARARFKREAEAASQVKSPHVVQTFDYGLTSEGVPFIVMEHLEGRDLAAEIAAHGALDPVRVITIISQVAKALSKAHASGLLHRDIKPDNIFLLHADADDELFVKLLDFGIAKTHVPGEEEMDAQTKTGQVIGTPFYMSPEQVTAQKVIDLRSDLWSLGIVAYEALTGKRPYDGPSFGALAVKIATGTPPKPSDDNPTLPPSVDTWFAQACAREPSARFASARELAEKLRAAFEGVVSLPPIASGGLSDSGPRGSGSGSRPVKVSSVPSAPGSGGSVEEGNAATAVDSRQVAPMSSIPAGPISVDDDARSRPSFVLASTMNQDSSSHSSLAQSEGGAAVAATTPPRPSPRARILLPVIALGIITLAITIGWKAKEHSGEGNGTSTPGSGVSISPRDPSPPASTAAALSSASAVVPAISDDAAVHTATSASAAPPPSASATSRVGVHPVPTPRPPPSASTKPVTPPTHPSTRPSDDPLF